MPDHDRSPRSPVGHRRRAGSARAGPRSAPTRAGGPWLARRRSGPAAPGPTRPAPATASGPRRPGRTARPGPAAPPGPTAPAAVGDQHGRVDQHPAAVMHRGEPAAAHRLGQRAGQPGPVGQQPQRRGPGVRHDPVPADFHGQIPRPRGKLIHLKGAPRSRQNVGFDTLILPGQGHLSPFRHAPPQDRHELSGLVRRPASGTGCAWRCTARPRPARGTRPDRPAATRVRQSVDEIAMAGTSTSVTDALRQVVVAELVAGAGHADEVGVAEHSVDVAPRQDLGQRVRTGDEEQLGVGGGGVQVGQRVDRCRWGRRGRCRRGSPRTAGSTPSRSPS